MVESDTEDQFACPDGLSTDAREHTIVPGFINAHTHLHELGYTLQLVDVIAIKGRAPDLAGAPAPTDKSPVLNNNVGPAPLITGRPDWRMGPHYLHNQRQNPTMRADRTRP